MRRTLSLTLLLLALLAPCALAAEQQPVTLSISAEKEVAVVENGVASTRRVPAETADSGEVLIYTLSYANRGDAPATNLAFANPIPERTVYVDGSASGDGTTIGFSVDGGKHYAALAELEIDGSNGRRPATAADVTHIRWRLDSVPPGGEGLLGFRVTVE